jgi:hypothetical protein
MRVVACYAHDPIQLSTHAEWYVIITHTHTKKKTQGRTDHNTVEMTHLCEGRGSRAFCWLLLFVVVVSFLF